MIENRNKRKIGIKYENIAANYLIGHGYNILEKNYRNRCGEIDILAEKDEVLIIVEVKFRKSTVYGDPLDAVDLRKQRRICRTTLYYYMEHGYGMDKPCRFDVIAIYGNDTIKHIEGAFEYQG